MAELTREEFTALLQKLDDVCRQAQELAEQIKLQMARRAAADQQLLKPHGGSERRRVERRPGLRN